MDQDARRSIQPHMGIRGLDGADLGQVDRVEGDYLKVTKDVDGNHHWIPDGLIMRVDQYVHLNVPAGEARQGWRDDDPNAKPGNDLHEKHERSDVKGERHHKTHEQRNEQQ